VWAMMQGRHWGGVMGPQGFMIFIFFVNGTSETLLGLLLQEQ